MKIEDISKILAESYFKKIGGIPSTSEDDDVYRPATGGEHITKNYIYRYNAKSKEVIKIYNEFRKKFNTSEQREIYSFFVDKIKREFQYRTFLQKFSGMNDKIFPLFIFYLYLKDSTFWNKGKGKVREKVLSALGYDENNPYNKWKFLEMEIVNFFGGLTLENGEPLFSYKATPGDIEISNPETTYDYNREYRNFTVDLGTSTMETENLLNQNPDLSYEELSLKTREHISPIHFELLKKKIKQRLSSDKEGLKNVDGATNKQIPK